MYTIVVATDFSKCANNAMTYALELSLRIKAKIRVVHVVYPNQGIDNSIYNAFWIDDYLALRNKDMRAWVAKFKKKPAFKDAQVEHHCEVGFTVPTIATFAEDHKADLIIVGTTGSTGLSTNLLGSVASGVISNVKIPVLAVPKDSTFDGAYDIAMATDLRIHLNNKSKDILREITEGTQSPLHLIHIIDKPGAMPDNSKPSTATPRTSNATLSSPAIRPSVRAFPSSA